MSVIVILTVMHYVGYVQSEQELCGDISCQDSGPVCGIRQEGSGYRLRLFSSECDLLKFGCNVEHNLAYGMISWNYCEQTFEHTSQKPNNTTNIVQTCTEFDCSYPTDTNEVCGIRQDGEGFKIRRFENRCQLWKYNCENKVQFNKCENHICDGLAEIKKPISMPLNATNKKIVVIDSSMINFKNFNESVQDFFAATHVFDLPMKEIHRDINETSRRMLVNIFGPVAVFKPWIVIPKNISEDYYHTPTLSSCFHKCPKKCPDTYAPVCGVPGIVAREPNLMFQNHCFMDVAQCKMFWEDKSPTAMSSNYIEASFLFCLGDELTGLYRFLPLVKTLQHMGRLKKKAHFRYKFQNMRFFNNLLAREPNLMG